MTGSNISDPWDSEYRRIWRATYSAYFALQVRDYKCEGHEILVKEDYDYFARQAFIVAAEAAERGYK